MATTLVSLKTYLMMDGDTEDGLLSLLLSMAENKALNKRYPFGYTAEQSVIALNKYSDTVLDICIYLYNKRGAEGQTGHSETGINRSYESGGIPNSFVQDIVPVCKVTNPTDTEDETA